MSLKTELLHLKNRWTAKYIYPVTRRRERSRLSNKSVTIISDNCWGGQVYQELGLPYQSPFVSLFIYSADYVKLLSDLPYYMAQDLVFIKTDKPYPVALLADVALHFQHYATEKEAREKWERRKARINWDNLFIKMNDAGCDDETRRAFDALPFDKKVFFSAKSYDDCASLVHFKTLENEGFIRDAKDMKVYRDYFDVIDWLNSRRENEI